MLLVATIALADEPFRNHRYDSFKVLAPDSESIVFIGNSITDMHCWPEAFITSDGKYLPIVNRGNSGTYSTEQSNNLESYIAGKPKNFSGEQVLQYVKSIVERIHKRSPETKVYLYSILNNKTGNRVEATWLHTNKIVREYVEAQNVDWLKYIDLYDKLTGIAQGGVWSYDNLHLTAAAYQVCARPSVNTWPRVRSIPFQQYTRRTHLQCKPTADLAVHTACVRHISVPCQ